MLRDGFHSVNANKSNCPNRRGSSLSPDDFVAGATEGGPPTVFGRLLCRLQDGAAALHGRGLGRLLVLGHHGAGLVRVETVREIRVGDPRRSGGRS